MKLNIHFLDQEMLDELKTKFPGQELAISIGGPAPSSFEEVKF